MALIILSILLLVSASLAFYFWLQWVVLTVYIAWTGTPVPEPDQIEMCKKFVFDNFFSYIKMTVKAMWISLKIKVLSVRRETKNEN